MCLACTARSPLINMRLPMLSLHPITDLAAIQDLKTAYLKNLIAPLDGMWDTGFINPSPHWEMRVDGKRAGYYAANDEGALLQFYVLPAFASHARALLDHVIGQETITQAVATTIDPAFLSLCLDAHQSLTVHTYLYEPLSEALHPSPPLPNGTTLRPVVAAEFERTLALQVDCLSLPDEMMGWLRGYTSNLIDRGELFVLCQDDTWLGLGECRKSDTQPGIADLGMMVEPNQRGKGLATAILSRLRAHCNEHNLHPICSTTVTNEGAQKAIARAGFVTRHRMMNIAF